jgi:hypothetical protein
MPLFVCHIGWMNLYEGLEGKPDRIVGGGRWVREHGYGGEVCNFLRCRNGYVYGHVETIKKRKDRPIRIEILGASDQADQVDGVDVLWTATHPTEGSRRLVGWYRNARVYRHRQQFAGNPSSQHRSDELGSYRIQAQADNVVLIPLAERILKLGHGKGWIGQANWWFPEESKNPEVKKFVRQARSLMSPMSRISLNKRITDQRRGWGRASDPEKNAVVEAAAIAVVEAHYAGYRIKSVEDENLGWDLEASKKGSAPLLLEVKGRSASDLQVGLTPREYRALVSHMNGKMDNYRLCVVTEALGAKPKLTIFRFSSVAAAWVNEFSGRAISPTITPIEAAIVSLS